MNDKLNWIFNDQKIRDRIDIFIHDKDLVYEVD